MVLSESKLCFYFCTKPIIAYEAEWERGHDFHGGGSSQEAVFAGGTKLSQLVKAGQDEEVWRVVAKGEAVMMAGRLWRGWKNQVIPILTKQFAQVVEFVVCA